MKLVRFGAVGDERPGMIDGQGRLRDLTGHISEIDPAAVAAGEIERLKSLDPESLSLVEGSPRLGTPLAGIGKIVCIGLNYSDHAAEAGAEAPKSPIAFFKPTSSLNGPNDPIRMLRNSRHMDWEVELCVVIGKLCSNVAEDQALSHVAGYCAANDVSERKFQGLGTGQWILGKSGDTFCPLGPWFVTADEVPDPQKLRLWLKVNGQTMQDGTTADMIFPVAHLVSYVSGFMSLNPGDIVLTGTPAGVGLGKKPPLYLKAGDRVELGIEGLGGQSNEIVAAE
jgi:2-keto-4-pentenoate hydratase/2-oxohepta-3-ene-1,7-dioic acid hydratase in catechol pathway